MNIDSREYIVKYNQLCKECDTIYHLAALRLGLSDCAFWILYTLRDSDRTYTQSEICEDSFLPRQTVNSALKKLEREGYLSLHRTGGKMGKTIRLTEKGELYAQNHVDPILRAETQVCAAFGNEEKAAFLQTFQSLVERLKSAVEETIGEGGLE